MSILTSIFEVFSAVAEWFVSAVTNMIPMFYVANPTAGETGGLTFIGTLAVVGLAIAIVLMLVATIRSYLQLSAR